MIRETWRVVIADDHAVVREGLRALVEREPGRLVVDQARTGEDAVAQAKEKKADLVFMDIEMPGMGGIEATRVLHEELPDAAVVIMTAHVKIENVRRALAAGARGFLDKAASSDEVDAVFANLELGALYVTPLAADLLSGSVLSQQQGAPFPIGNGSRTVTARETEILALLSQGYSARRIAKQLDITERTVNSHIDHAYRKLGVTNRVEAIWAAVRLGVIEAPA